MGKTVGSCFTKLSGCSLACVVLLSLAPLSLIALPATGTAGDLLPAGPRVVATASTSASGMLIAPLSGNRFMLLWRDGTVGTRSMFGRFHDDEGNPLGADFEVANSATCSPLGVPLAVDVYPDDSFVVIFNCSGDDTLRFQRVDATGATLGSSVVVTDSFGLPASLMKVAVGDGGFYVSYLRSSDVFAQHFSVAGVSSGPEFVVFDNAFCCTTVKYGIDLIAGGDLVATEGMFTGVTNELLATRVNSSGVTVTSPFVVHEPGIFPGASHVLAESDGGYSVLWQTTSEILNARRFDAADTATGATVSLPVPLLAGVSDITTPQRSSTGYMFIARDTYVERVYRLDNAFAQIGSSFPVDEYRATFVTGLAADAGGNPIVASVTPGLGFQRFCDSDDPACDRCAGFDDSLDADGDGLPDLCDECTNVANARAMDKARLFITKGGDAKVSKFRLKGDTDLPVAFSEFDPSIDGLRIGLFGAVFGDIVDDRLPADAESGTWELKGGKTWKFKGESASTAVTLLGQWRIVVKDRSNKAPGRVRVSAKHTGGVYRFVLLNLLDIPPRAVFNFGDESAANSDLCGEHSFLLENCKTNDGLNPSIRCK